MNPPYGLTACKFFAAWGQGAQSTRFTASPAANLVAPGQPTTAPRKMALA